MKKANPTLTIEGFCNRLNQQLDKLEFSATAFHVALSSENLKESTLERVLDPENVIGLCHGKNGRSQTRRKRDLRRAK